MTGVEQGVLVLCERYGYGRIMQIASELWIAKDPNAALTLGPTFDSIQRKRKHVCDRCGEVCWLTRTNGVNGGWASACHRATYKVKER